MNRFFKALAGLAVAAALAACGGGGGSPGATPGGGGGGGGDGGGGDGGTTGSPTLSLSLVNSSGTAIPGNAVTPGSTVFLRALVKDGDGDPVTNKLVTFTSGGVIAFQPASGQVLTDPVTGIATVQVMPADLTSTGADTLTASASVNDAAVSASIDVQTSAANVALRNMRAVQTTLTAYQNTTVSVDATVGGQPATTIPVTVGFSTSCGRFSPASVITDSSGTASATFQAEGCTGGNATLTASAPGASPVQTTVNVQAPQPTNLLFVSATPSTIFTSGASSGAKQSTVVFKLVDAAGNPITTSTQVRVSLSSAAIAAGVVFADTNTTTPKLVSTDVTGSVQVIVKSGGFPTPLSLDAVLVSNTSITASSSGLTVNSGRAVQNFFSLSAEKFNIEGWRYDGETTSINILAADRLAQPLPEGTTVSFIGEGGQVTASCSLTINSDKKSGCSVSLTSQDFRPDNGRVTVLAYMDGDEIFVDENGDNRYQSGETFYDMGQPFLDADENGTRSSGEQRVGNASTPGSGIGTTACAAHPSGTNPYLIANVANTCDGAWGSTRVRAQAVIVFSDSYAVTEDEEPGTVFTNLKPTSVDVVLRDHNGNPLPAGTTLAATVSTIAGSCSVSRIIPDKVPSTTTPTVHRLVLTGAGCSGATLNGEATTPKGNTTLLGSVLIP